jgi:hypothetical protein
MKTKRKYLANVLFVLAVTCVPSSLLRGADINSLNIPDVTVMVSDFTLDYSPASKEVALKPAAGGAVRTGTSAADGGVNFTRVTPGIYTLTIAGIGMDPLTLKVPNQSGTLNASALVISAWTPPSQASYAGATANLRAWSLLSTSNTALNGWLTLSGQTNQIGDNGSALTYNGSAVGGVGGDTVWTNDSGVIKPSGVGASINQIRIYEDGGMDIGYVASRTVGGIGIERDTSAGSINDADLKLALTDSHSNPTNIANAQLRALLIDNVPGLSKLYLDVSTNSYDTYFDVDLRVTPTSVSLKFENENGDLMLLNPTAADGSTTYVFDTSIYHTSGNLFEVKNFSTNKFSVDFAGTVTATSYAVGAAVGLSTNINVLVAGGTTNQLQFTKGILTGVVPQ